MVSRVGESGFQRNHSINVRATYKRKNQQIMSRPSSRQKATQNHQISYGNFIPEVSSQMLEGTERIPSCKSNSRLLTDMPDLAQVAMFQNADEM